MSLFSVSASSLGSPPAAVTFCASVPSALRSTVTWLSWSPAWRTNEAERGCQASSVWRAPSATTGSLPRRSSVRDLISRPAGPALTAKVSPPISRPRRKTTNLPSSTTRGPTGAAAAGATEAEAVAVEGPCAHELAQTRTAGRRTDRRMSREHASARRRCLPDVVLQEDAPLAALDLHGERAGRPQPRVNPRGVVDVRDLLAGDRPD